MSETNIRKPNELSEATCLPLLCDVGSLHGKPVVVRRILDLFCGAGGAAMGLHRAFPEAEIVGVDIKEQPRYPFKFVRGDAMEYPLEGFDFVWASPPCQHFTKYKNARKDLPNRYPDLIVPVRKKLEGSGAWWVIENVVGAPLLNPIVLCGSMFGLDVRRHRLFEMNFWALQPPCSHDWQPNRFPGGRSRERGHARVKCRGTVEVGRWNIPIETQEAAMGIDWMELEELSEAIPPAYSEWVGKACRAIISTNGA